MNFRQIPLLIVASIWYLVVTTVLSIGQHYIERYFGRGIAQATATYMEYEGKGWIV